MLLALLSRHPRSSDIAIIHKTPTCTNGFAKALFVAPTGWDEATNTIIAPVVAGLRALNLQARATQDDGYLSEDAALTSELDEEECVELHFPPLSVELIGSQRSIQTLALADTGASSLFLSGKIVDTLGLEKRRLKVPRTVRLAIKGRDETELLITHYVHVPLCLLNGTLETGCTYFKVAALKEPYGAVLGAPFLAKHCIDVHVGLTPALLCRSSSSPNVTLDLLAPCSGAPTLAEARKTMSLWEASQSEADGAGGGSNGDPHEGAELEREEEKEEKEHHEQLEELALLDHEMR
jgi:hypothetical protein